MAGGDMVEAGTIYIAPAKQIQSVSHPTRPGLASTSGLIVNNNPSDVSVIQAGGEILYANAAVAGPGQLYVQAGGSIYQGGRRRAGKPGPAERGRAECRIVADWRCRDHRAGRGRRDGAGLAGFAQTYLAPAMGYGSALLDYLQTTDAYTGD